LSYRLTTLLHPDTVVHNFKKWSDQLADFTVLPKSGVWRHFLDKHPWLMNWIQQWSANRAAKKRLNRGFETADPDKTNEDTTVDPTGTDDPENELDLQITYSPNITTLASEAEKDAAGIVPHTTHLSRRLALAIKRVAADLHLTEPKRYEYEEWVEFTRLIRITRIRGQEADEEEGLVDWDWIGSDSPLMSGLSEPEWLLHRLCESLVRLEKKKEIAALGGRRDEREQEESVEGGGEREEGVLASGADETLEKPT
jgi:potassium channel subfamily K